MSIFFLLPLLYSYFIPRPVPKPEEPNVRARLDGAPTQNKPVFIGTLLFKLDYLPLDKQLTPCIIDPHKSETGDITGYNRQLIFTPDGMEYSFEEIRAAKYAYLLTNRFMV